jgi:hypothetical protein
MQTVIQVICKPGPSLREAISNYRSIERFSLQVTLQKRPGRRHGWAKIHALDGEPPGALNIEWDPNTHILMGRVVTKGKNRPNRLISYFVDFLLGSRFRGRIKSISIFPR